MKTEDKTNRNRIIKNLNILALRIHMYSFIPPPQPCHCGVEAWNNGKSIAKLDLTSLTTSGLQIHKFDHTRTANPCDWLLCRRTALLLVGCPHSLVYLHLPVVEGLIFCISATPHLGTSFPLFHGLGWGREGKVQDFIKSLMGMFTRLLLVAVFSSYTEKMSFFLPCSKQIISI